MPGSTVPQGPCNGCTVDIGGPIYYVDGVQGSDYCGAGEVCCWISNGSRSAAGYPVTENGVGYTKCISGQTTCPSW